MCSTGVSASRAMEESLKYLRDRERCLDDRRGCAEGCGDKVERRVRGNGGSGVID